MKQDSNRRQLSNHFTRLDGGEHGAEIVAAGFGQGDVSLDGLTIEAFALGDHASAFSERFREVSAGKRKWNASTEQGAGIVAILEQAVFALVRRGEHPENMGRDAFKRHEQLANHVAPQPVRLIHDVRAPRLHADGSRAAIALDLANVGDSTG